jgi:hypothetical protein
MTQPLDPPDLGALVRERLRDGNSLRIEPDYEHVGRGVLTAGIEHNARDRRWYPETLYASGLGCAREAWYRLRGWEEDRLFEEQPDSSANLAVGRAWESVVLHALADALERGAAPGWRLIHYGANEYRVGIRVQRKGALPIIVSGYVDAILLHVPTGRCFPVEVKSVSAWMWAKIIEVLRLVPRPIEEPLAPEYNPWPVAEKYGRQLQTYLEAMGSEWGIFLVCRKDDKEGDGRVASWPVARDPDWPMLLRDWAGVVDREDVGHVPPMTPDGYLLELEGDIGFPCTWCRWNRPCLEQLLGGRVKLSTSTYSKRHKRTVIQVDTRPDPGFIPEQSGQLVSWIGDQFHKDATG